MPKMFHINNKKLQSKLKFLNDPPKKLSKSHMSKSIAKLSRMLKIFYIYIQKHKMQSKKKQNKTKQQTSKFARKYVNVCVYSLTAVQLVNVNLVPKFGWNFDNASRTSYSDWRG